MSDRAKQIFLKALELPDASRSKLIREECKGDPELEQQVWGLLGADAQAESQLYLEIADDARLSPDQAASTSQEKSLPYQKIGGYEVQGRLGHGGAAIVLEALQPRTRRKCALKVIRGVLATDEDQRRLLQEAQLLSKFDHPNIASVFEAGVHEDALGAVPFVALDLVENAVSLLDWVQDKKLNQREILELFLKVLSGVTYAHQRGVIHRDLKPANILVGPDGEPKIIDFGIARSLELDQSLVTVVTETGRLLGTPRYMSPEQCDAQPVIDTRSDLYSLAVILYELLTDTLPYPTDSSIGSEVLSNIRTRPPASIRARVGRDLDTILLHALEKSPENRYESVHDFANDLRRVLAHEPISVARRNRSWYVATRWVRRHAILTTMLSLTVVATIATLLIITNLLNQSREAERDIRKSLRAIQELMQGNAPSMKSVIYDFDETLLDSAQWEFSSNKNVTQEGGKLRFLVEVNNGAFVRQRGAREVLRGDFSATVEFRALDFQPIEEGVRYLGINTVEADTVGRMASAVLVARPEQGIGIQSFTTGSQESPFIAVDPSQPGRLRIVRTGVTAKTYYSPGWEDDPEEWRLINEGTVSDKTARVFLVASSPDEVPFRGEYDNFSVETERVPVSVPLQPFLDDFEAGEDLRFKRRFSGAIPYRDGGKLRFDKLEGYEGDGLYYLDASQAYLEGDFTLSVDYDLIDFPPPTGGGFGISLGVWAISGDEFVGGIERCRSNNSLECEPSTDYYKPIRKGGHPCDVPLFVATRDQGKLVVSRRGNKLLLGWQDGDQHGSHEMDCPETPLAFSLKSYTSGNPDAHSMEFDNLELTIP